MVPPTAGRRRAKGLFWAAVGIACLVGVTMAHLDKQLYLVGAGALLWGLALLAHELTEGAGFFGTIMHDLEFMPHTMRRLVPVQFFSWLALFAMWIYTTPAVTQVHFHRRIRLQRPTTKAPTGSA